MIAGMDEIVEYIKTLENKNEKLKERNKFLEERNNTLLKYETSEYCNGVCCERMPMLGRSWWKCYGFNEPCKCAYTIKRQDEKKEQEDKIKKLEKQNEKLEEQNKELEEKVDEANKIMKEYKELKEFKEKAEEECEASAVMEDMMNRIKEAERKESMWYVKYKNQEPLLKEIRKENELLGEALITSYDLDNTYAVNGLDWDDRFSNFYNHVMTKVRDVEWTQLLEDNDIQIEWGEGIEEQWEDSEIREQYCRETQGDEEDAQDDWNSIVNESDWDEWEGAFTEWYLNDYLKSDNWWCDYDGNYWYIKK
jgi:cell division protein FtsB